MLLICFHISNRSSLVLHSRFSLSCVCDHTHDTIRSWWCGRMRRGRAGAATHLFEGLPDGRVDPLHGGQDAVGGRGLNGLVEVGR